MENNTSKLRYFEALPETPQKRMPRAFHTEFLRTGRIIRGQDDWVPEEKRYLTTQEVAARTGQRLEAVGENTHSRINSFHSSIRFPKLLFHKTLENIPHLGYCHVTASRCTIGEFADVRWAFYIANFNAEIGGEENFFRQITPEYGRMYFAVALKADSDRKEMLIDRSVRPDGLLFRTSNPMQALKNVLMLGARDSDLRKIIASM